MANHLTPSELADQLQMKRQEVIGKCVEMGVPIFHGRIDRTLFESSLRSLGDPTATGAASAAAELHAELDSPAMEGRGTNSKTLADLLPRAAETYGDAPAVRYKDGEQLGQHELRPRCVEIVRPLALGLTELGVEKGDRVSILGNTRPEWTYFDFAALSIGATVVPIYQTNSPEECRYVLENSDAKVVVVEDAEQLEKIREVRDQLPQLEHVVLMTGTERRRALDGASWPRKARGGDAAAGSSATRRSPRRTSAPSSTPRARPGRRRAASSATATTGRCSTWSTRPASSRTKTSPTSTCRSPTPSRC